MPESSTYGRKGNANFVAWRIWSTVFLAALVSGCTTSVTDDSLVVNVGVSPRDGPAPLNVSLEISSPEYSGSAEWVVWASLAAADCLRQANEIARGHWLPASSSAILAKGDWKICVTANAPGYYGSGSNPAITVFVR